MMPTQREANNPVNKGFKPSFVNSFKLTCMPTPAITIVIKNFDKSFKGIFTISGISPIVFNKLTRRNHKMNQGNAFKMDEFTLLFADFLIIKGRRKSRGSRNNVRANFTVVAVSPA